MNGLLAIAATTQLMSGTNGEAPLGATYAITEPDALAEIETASAGKSVSLADFGDSGAWSATRSALLPVAERDSIRDVIPFFTLPFDIPDKDGKVLYPKGFTFNPLEHLTLPNALLIVRPEQLDWAIAVAAPADMILLAGGNALTESEGRRTPVYLLEPKLAERLKIAAAPSRVWQKGHVLKVQEIAASRLSRAAARGDGASVEGAAKVETEAGGGDR
jgi:conjugal transfer pilus assembly protein TraW